MQKKGTMEYTFWHTLVWLLPAFTVSTQGLAKVSVTTGITAGCGEQVTLNCSVLSSQKNLLINHLQWFQGQTSVCSVNKMGKITAAPSLKDLHCKYKDGQLSLIFARVKPLDTGDFTCKLHSNQGNGKNVTRVELQECCGEAEGVLTKDRVTCIFRNVYPDGEVHWFHDAHNLSDGSTSKQVDEGGWLTIRSDLQRQGSRVPYNCSLMSATSGRYIASTLVANTVPVLKAILQPTPKSHSGVGWNRPIWTCLFYAVLLAATLN